MNIKRHVPNAITLLNLFSGCIALYFAFEQNYMYAFYFVALGIFFDFFDGFFARMFKVSGELGKQLDSLADMVTSGVVPGVVMFLMMQNSIRVDASGWITFFPFLGFIITLGSCMRLARFNLDTRQSDSFIGLPTPANALFILSLPIVLQATESFAIVELLTDKIVLLVITLFSAFILNAELPLFSLKIKNFSLKQNAIQMVFLLLSIVLLVALRETGVPLIIILYVLMSVINYKLAKR